MIYIVFYEMLYCGSHLESVPVSGVSQVRLRHPTINYCEQRRSTNCHVDFSLPENQPYCKGSRLEYAYEKKPCEYWSDSFAQLPDGEGVSLTTRIRTYNVTKTCIPNSALNISCPELDEWAFTLMKDVYAIDAERFWIWIEHFMTSGREKLSSKGSAMKGFWLSCESSSCQYQELLPLPSDFAVVPKSEDKEQVPPAATPSVPAKMGENGTNPSLLQATRTKSSRSHSEALARKLQSRKSYAKTRIRSQRSTTQHDASSARSAKVLRTEPGNTRGEHFVMTKPAHWKDWEFDAMPLQYLLDLVNKSLDDHFKGLTYRQKGVSITIDLRYLNTQSDSFDFVGLRLFPWSEPLLTKLPWDPEGYTRARYLISARASEQGYTIELNEGNKYTDDHYIQRRRNGIYISIAQSGQMLVWSWSRTAIYVSTAVGLLRFAFYLTEFWAWSCRGKTLQSLMHERYVRNTDSGRYERVDRPDDLT
eukprot:TRINITY_DN3932_c0_g3_i1.p1 TRINITY_DN3932_c0_g3~~TRINITY_DN3932_c0_g3_i1.p1  ORF type:complete len:512 (-),score=19.43 TRINITY_DN3932_c0_g3_i1:219-1646(-)